MTSEIFEYFYLVSEGCYLSQTSERPVLSANILKLLSVKAESEVGLLFVEGFHTWITFQSPSLRATASFRSSRLVNNGPFYWIFFRFCPLNHYHPDTWVPSPLCALQVLFSFPIHIDSLSAQSMIISSSNGHCEETLSVVGMRGKPQHYLVLGKCSNLMQHAEL